jgi:predicted nucleic acid-binding protein
MMRRGLESHRHHADKAWSLTDCASIDLMRQRGIMDALAHDHHFVQACLRAMLAD